MNRKNPSPCLRCTRVKNPRACEDKDCKDWQKWFLERWALIHAYPRVAAECQKPQPGGVVVGGQYYASPHQVENYLHTDPCKQCLCPKDLCKTPCRVKRDWQKNREDVML